jgi:hypothetical protein
MGGISLEVRAADGRTIVYCDRPSHPIPREEAEANARLIAAAPQLLAACRDCISVLIQFVEVQEKDWFKAAQAAVAKATGQAR